MTLRTLNSGNYGIFLIMVNAGFCPSTVWGILLQFINLETLQQSDTTWALWTLWESQIRKYARPENANNPNPTHLRTLTSETREPGLGFRLKL